MPNPAEFVPELNDVSAALFRATGNRSVPRTTMNLVHLRAGQIVGNTYLTILNTGFLRKAGESEERITAVSSWQDAPYFTDAERAGLPRLRHQPRHARRRDPRGPGEAVVSLRVHGNEHDRGEAARDRRGAGLR
ncbi:carboxymuconolactone decarboxylase family protein [Streptomyces sp. V4I23]|uniref:carboxymuconolactone decarboxylase family protein n=1 Tax=Streptomyces sp. V4I23 TaxID=3042282 RepID=UPI00359000BF